MSGSDTKHVVFFEQHFFWVSVCIQQPIAHTFPTASVKRSRESRQSLSAPSRLYPTGARKALVATPTAPSGPANWAIPDHHHPTDVKRCLGRLGRVGPHATASTEEARALRSPAALAPKLGDRGQDGGAHAQGLAGTFLSHRLYRPSTAGRSSATSGAAGGARARQRRQRCGCGWRVSQRCYGSLPLGGSGTRCMADHTCRRNAKLICNGHGVCGTYVPHHCSPIVVWTHSNDCVAIHTHVGYEMGRYTL
eukprot:COSAG01_NODE_8098_length_2921_cov_64.658165_2_plen_250_part_00